MAEVEREQRLAELRERFRRAGLPLFDEEFSASTDVFNRAAPLLALVFLGEMLGAIQLDWSLLANVAAALGGLALLLVAAGVFNLLRGRSFTAIPNDVQAPELVAFVLLPALLPLVFGGQGTSALGTIAANLGLLALIYAVLGYGLPSIMVWVVRRLAGQLAASLMLMARAIPLLLIFGLLTFLTTEMWQVFSAITDADLIAIGVLFLMLGVLFLLVRLPREVRSLETEEGEGQPPLATRERRNVALVLFVSQAMQVLIVSLMIGLFFVVFGTIAIPESVREAWIGSAGNTLIDLDLFGEQFQVTEELLKVTAGLAAFSGLYFAIAMLTDSTYRDEFLTEVTGELRQTFADRAEYLRLRSATPN